MFLSNGTDNDMLQQKKYCVCKLSETIVVSCWFCLREQLLQHVANAKEDGEQQLGTKSFD